jgi:hypothetical protein
VTLLKRFKPGVSKYWLLALAGVMWSAVGVLLCRRAYGWFGAISRDGAIPLELFGAFLAVTAYRFGFSKIAKKNTERLCKLKDKTCVFAFQTWKGYLLIGLMMILSAFLRRSPIPEIYLALLYMTIGGALLLSSFTYYRLLWQRVVRKESC